MFQIWYQKPFAFPSSVEVETLEDAQVIWSLLSDFECELLTPYPEEAHCGVVSDKAPRDEWDTALMRTPLI